MRKRLGWLPGSYHTTQLDGHYRGGAGARGAFDGGTYDNGPTPPPSKLIPVSKKVGQPRSKPAPPVPKPPPPPAKAKSWKEPPFNIGDSILCGALKGTFAPCVACRHTYMTVRRGCGELPAVLECRRCGARNRYLRRSHLAGGAA
jgi:hypothetical protein